MIFPGSLRLSESSHTEGAIIAEPLRVWRLGNGYQTGERVAALIESVGEA